MCIRDRCSLRDLRQSFQWLLTPHYMYILYMYLANLLVIGNSADEPWPEAVRNVVGEPEPSQWRLVAPLVVWHWRLWPVAEDVGSLGIRSIVWHEWGNDDMATLDSESHFKFLQETDVLVPEGLRNVALREECTHISHSCTCQATAELLQGSLYEAS